MTDSVVIKSNQPTFTVHDGDQSVFTWIIEPDKNPDRYYLARTSREKTVIFTTENGDVSIRILPNKTYPISFQNTNSTAHAEIISRDDHSIFMRPFMALSVLFVFVISALLLRKFLDKIQTKYLLNLGLTIPALFWVSTVVGGLLHGNYSHATDVVSELGALGTKSEVFMSSSELLLAGFLVLFFVGLQRTLGVSNRSIIPAIPILFFAAALVGVAFFPLENQLHPLVGSLSFPLMIAPALSLIMWRGSGLSKTYKALTIASILCMLCFAFRFVPSVNQEFEGLVQRTFYLSWSIWFIAIYSSSKSSSRAL